MLGEQISTEEPIHILYSNIEFVLHASHWKDQSEITFE